MKPYHVSVAAESYTATLFAWLGYDVLVQYGANQPYYDLAIRSGNTMFPVSVKGSKDGGWGLTQSFKKGRSYYEAINIWDSKHPEDTILSLVQFKGVDPEKNESPRVYLATPKEIGEQMKLSRNFKGDTVLKENYTWKKGVAKGTSYMIPEEWMFSKKRVETLLAKG